LSEVKSEANNFEKYVVEINFQIVRITKSILSDMSTSRVFLNFYSESKGKQIASEIVLMSNRMLENLNQAYQTQITSQPAKALKTA